MTWRGRRRGKAASQGAPLRLISTDARGGRFLAKSIGRLVRSPDMLAGAVLCLPTTREIYTAGSTTEAIVTLAKCHRALLDDDD